MGRPVKWRRIEQMPSFRHFSPDLPKSRGEPEEIILLVEELEAIRLKDQEMLEQEACAEQMQVSRATFQRILTTARSKIADSLIQGKAILISGGNFTRNICRVKCLDCGAVWDESYEKLSAKRQPLDCPECQSRNISCLPTGGGLGPRRGARSGFCQGRCRQGRPHNNPGAADQGDSQDG